MELKHFSQLEFRHITLETAAGDIEGLFSDLRLDTNTLPDGLIPYYIRASGADDSVPATIETHVAVDRFGTLIVNAPLDFGDSDHIVITDWGLDEDDDDNCPEWIKRYLEGEETAAEVKSFVDYFVERQKIDTGAVRCIRTCGRGEKAVLRVEYAASHKDHRPVLMAKEYLRDVYGYSPENLNFNNAHYDRIGCSALNVFDVPKEDFDKYSSMPTVIHSQFNEDEGRGELEFAIHNDRQRELSYARELHEYFSGNRP
jgi:hypothetical protein